MANEMKKLTINAENGSFTFEVVDEEARSGSGTGGSSPIKYHESLDRSNPAFLRDLESGSYVLYGYYKPFNGSSTNLTFDGLLANVVNISAGSHILVFSTLNSKVDFLAIEVDSTQASGYKFERTNMSLLDLNALIAKVGNLNNLSTTEKGSLVAAINEVAARHYPDWSHLKWYVMGDSLTSRDNANTDKRYYDFVQEKTGIQIIVDGIGGTGYGAGVSNNQSFLDRVKNIPDDVDVVTIFGSGNDILHLELANIPIYDTLAWLAFNRPGLRVIVVPPSPWKDYNKREDPWKAYCDRLQTCALACDFRYVSDMWECPPFNGRLEGHMEKFFTTDSTGIHPNENGHKALAPYFYNALLQELALKV